jgi:carboxymethylenebutenolidase
MVLHFGAADQFVTEAVRGEIVNALAARAETEVYVYPAAAHGFAYPGTEGFSAPAASIAFSRSLGLLRRTIGPHYDLSALWDAHTDYEFAARDPEKTMATMTSKPYVNHIPTMTGGYGYAALHRFYREFFIPQMPKDTTATVWSRTVGSDRVIDEILFSFTHDVAMEWMIPGIPPTGRRIEIPLIAVVQFRGAKIFNEHIYWDQASLLTQLGVLEPKGLPIAGVEQARKLTDESLPSNALIRAWSAKPTKP